MLCCSSSAQSQCGSTVYTHSQGKVEGNLWVHTQQQQQQHTHSLPKKGKKDSISRGANSSSNDDDDDDDEPHHHSVCCNQSVILLFCSSFFLQHGHTLNQQIQLLWSLCLFFLFFFPSLSPSLPFPSSPCKQDNSFVQHLALGR